MVDLPMIGLAMVIFFNCGALSWVRNVMPRIFCEKNVVQRQNMYSKKREDIWSVNER
jgi:hypothetical protein